MENEFIDWWMNINTYIYFLDLLKHFQCPSLCTAFVQCLYIFLYEAFMYKFIPVSQYSHVDFLTSNQISHNTLTHTQVHYEVMSRHEMHYCVHSILDTLLYDNLYNV